MEGVRYWRRSVPLLLLVGTVSYLRTMVRREGGREGGRDGGEERGCTVLASVGAAAAAGGHGLLPKDDSKKGGREEGRHRAGLI